MSYKHLPILVLLLLSCIPITEAQNSVAREWNEVLLDAIRSDFARPTVHARNLFHTSIVMYDAWAVYDESAETYLLGKSVDGFPCLFYGVDMPADIEAAREEAMSYAVYRLLKHRFRFSPGVNTTLPAIDAHFLELGYDSGYTSTNYSTNNPAALGNYIAECMINFGYQDGANEQNRYENQYYSPVNQSMIMALPGNPRLTNFNRWQPLTLEYFVDQAGNPIPFNTPDFLGPEWGQVSAFSLSVDDLRVYQRDGFIYKVFHDPGTPPYHNMDTVGGLSEEYKWGFSLVAAWSSHLDASDSTMIDISPATIGNIQSYPSTIEGLRTFYDLENGGDASIGHPMNPSTGQPYEPQIIPRGDYTRILAEFWADGPDSETPPGHWFTLLNYVSDHPETIKKFRGQGEVLGDLEWDVKSYFLMGATMHDVAVSAWGIKGWYDYIRPVSAIRGMAELGQSSDPDSASYHPGGIHLIPGYIELVREGDTLAGMGNVNVGKIKVYAWKGPSYINNPDTDEAGVDWILAENWWPYQRPSFVTPPFAGYISGHSTYSRAAADIMTYLTGDAFFPGGMGQFSCEQNQFLVFENGPSQDVVLQWATYRDASDQCSLSRIWGGIHPPVDDIPGRLIGEKIGLDAFLLAESYFYKDEDQDGYYNYVDCDDNNPLVNPGMAETCDSLDNDCNGIVNDSLDVFTYYLDSDNDGYGDPEIGIDTCAADAIAGYVTNDLDCNDADSLINPSMSELCDSLDNDCNGIVNDSLDVFTYYLDSDNDGYGDPEIGIDTCAADAIAGYVANDLDCNDADSLINPSMPELCDSLDNDCNGIVNDSLDVFTYYLDSDNDGYGNPEIGIDTCAADVIAGYVTNDLDCNDADSLINPSMSELCDSLDNDCNGIVNDSLDVFTYYPDNDNDGYGDPQLGVDTCVADVIMGYVLNDLDCDDTDSLVNPDAMEIAHDGIDNNCNGIIDEIVNAVKQPDVYREIFPNPVQGTLTIKYTGSKTLIVELFNVSGVSCHAQELTFVGNKATMNFESLPHGIYFAIFKDRKGKQRFVEKIVKL